VPWSCHPCRCRLLIAAYKLIFWGSAGDKNADTDVLVVTMDSSARSIITNTVVVVAVVAASQKVRRCGFERCAMSSTLISHES